MVVSVAVHRDSPGSDKTFLICIARRPSLNDPKDRPSLLGFDQFSSRINLNYEIENLDARWRRRKRKCFNSSTFSSISVIWNLKRSIWISLEKIFVIMFTRTILTRSKDIFKKVRTKNWPWSNWCKKKKVLRVHWLRKKEKFSRSFLLIDFFFSSFFSDRRRRSEKCRLPFLSSWRCFCIYQHP